MEYVSNQSHHHLEQNLFFIFTHDSEIKLNSTKNILYFLIFSYIFLYFLIFSYILKEKSTQKILKKAKLVFIILMIKYFIK